jgi:DNA invertase Pin-like site-specific DNA recombinase
VSTTHSGAKRVALYARCSTDEQTTANQIRQLQTVAKRHGWAVVKVYDDNGISGGIAREDRPAMKELMRAVSRRDVDMVAAWSVDRLGRSMLDLLGLLGELHAKGVDLYLHQQGLDTSTPAGRAMFQMLGVFAEFERGMIQERIRAGLARAQAEGTKSGRPIGAPPVDPAKVKLALQLLADGRSQRHVARETGLGKGTVGRLQARRLKAA